MSLLFGLGPIKKENKMKYEDVQKLRKKYKTDSNTIRLEHERNVAVKNGEFEKAFKIQQDLENMWFNMLNNKEVTK